MSGEVAGHTERIFLPGVSLQAVADHCQPIAGSMSAAVPVDVDKIAVRCRQSFGLGIRQRGAAQQGWIEGLQMPAGKRKRWAVGGGRQYWHENYPTTCR